MLDKVRHSIMVGVQPFMIITGGALGVELEAEKLARDHGLTVQVIIPPCHPRSKTVPPLTITQLAKAIPIRLQVAARLNKQQTQNPVTFQYIHRNYHVVEQADMVLAFTNFQPESNMCFGATGWAVEMAKLLRATSWAVEMAKLLNKILYVYDVEKQIWLWYRQDQDLFYACDQMSDEEFALLTFQPNTAIVGIRNIYDFPDALLELNDTFKRSIPGVVNFCTQ